MEEKLENNVDEQTQEVFEDDGQIRITKNIVLTNKGYPALWVQTFRFVQPACRYGAAASFCSSNGQLENVLRTGMGYFQNKRLVRISQKGAYIEANYSLDSEIIKIYKIEKIDIENRKAVFKRVATRTNGIWDNTAYMRQYKIGVHSALMRAKKCYYLQDVD